MLRKKHGIVLLVIAGAIAIFTALAHLSCLYFGPQCYKAQMAPKQIVDSAVNGTLIAPVGNLIISTLFIVMACYALSGAQLIRKLPLLGLGVYTISVLCIVRGVLPLQLWLRHPSKVSDVVLLVGSVWLGVGLFYLFGYKAVKSTSS